MTNYLLEVSDLFLRRRGGTLNLSPLDWQTISEWELHNIPLHVVIRAINDVFDIIEQKPKHLRPRVKSISYCSEEIEAAFENWREMQVGR